MVFLDISLKITRVVYTGESNYTHYETNYSLF